ncbi:MAG: MG2 domain-containing protein, partial [Lentisphaerota bacterium]
MNWLDRNKWFFLAALFLVVNTWGLYRLKPAGQNGNQKVYVAFEPGDGASVESNRPLAWVFSEPMIQADQAGREKANGPVTITPSVQGVFTWVDPRRLEFRPADAWPSCTPFSSTLKSELRSLGGKELAPPATTAFATPSLRLKSAWQVNFTSDRRVTLHLEFSDPVSPSTLEKFLDLESPRGQPLKWTAAGQADSRVIRLLTEPVGADYMVVKARAGLHSPSGPLALESDQELQIKCYDQLAIHKVLAESEAFENSCIRIRTSKPLDLDTAASFIEVRPETPFTLESSTWYWEGEEYALRGNFEPGKTYVVTFRNGLQGTDDSLLTKGQTFNVYVPDRPASLSFKTSGHYLSTKGNLLVALSVVNLRQFKLTARRVYANNLVQFMMRKEDNYSYFYGSPENGISAPPLEKTFEVSAPANQIRETRIDLRECLAGEPSGAYLLKASSETGGSAEQLVVVTDTGLSVSRSDRDLLVWANSIYTLQPATGATIRVFSQANQLLAQGQTDAQGLARLEGDFTGDREPFLVTSEQGNDLSYLALQGTGIEFPETSGGRSWPEGYEAFVFTDRGIYRPGETSHVSLVVRDAQGACPPAFPVELHVIKPDGKTRQVLKTMLSEFGTATLDCPWADYDATGLYELRVRPPGATQWVGSATVALEEFVPPQIAVEIEAPDTRANPANNLAFTVSAHHLFGPPAAANPVRALIRFVPVDFKCSAFPDFVFADPEKEFTPAQKSFGDHRLDVDGQASFEESVSPSWKPASSLRAVMEATVIESGGRAVSTFKSRPVDVYPSYVGLRLRSGSGVRMTGERQTADLVIVNPDGSLTTNPATLQCSLARVSWSSVLRREMDGRYAFQSERRLTPVSQTNAVLDKGKGLFEFTVDNSGPHVLLVSNPETGASASIPFYAGSPDQAWQAWSMETPDRVEIQPDKTSYRVGEEAVLVIKAPFTGKALMTLETDHVIESRVLLLEKNTAEIRIPIVEALKPNVHCTLSLVRGITPGEMWSAHRAAGRVSLAVDMPEIRLNAALTAPRVIRPKEKLQAEVRITDASGAGVEAEVMVAAVDEGICMLTDFESPDPAAYFSSPRRDGVSLFDLYSLLMPELEKKIAGGASSPGGDGDSASRRRLNPVKARRFKPVALFVTAKTGPDGKTSVAWDIPEFTGTLRLMAVSVSKKAFASSQTNVVVKRPLVVRSSLPRFLAPGDQCMIPVELFNETGANGEATVRLDCAGPVSAQAMTDEAEPATQHIAVKQGDSASLVFQLTAAQKPGKALVTLRASLGAETFSEEIELPVRPASPLITKSGSGFVRPGENLRVELPGNWMEGTARYVLQGSGMPGVELNGGLDYLLNYPYGCLEQTTSASFPLLFLLDLMEQIRPGQLTQDQVRHYVQ